MLYKNGIDLSTKLVEFINSSNNLFIYTPYIKLNTLKTIIDSTNAVKAVFVRWETKDLLLGSSDLDIYPFLRDRGVSVYRNTRLHLKAYINNYEKCFLTSANISSRALNVPENNKFNYEVGTIINSLNIEDRLYFSIIEKDSVLITDSIYQKIFEQLPEKKIEYPNETDFELKIETPDKNFLISALPLTYSVETLFRIYEEKTYINEIELNCAIHDLATYKIPFGLSPNEFKTRLETEFFNHAFIKLFIDELLLKGEMYFGEVKTFIHNNCANVPLPRKWEITENIQIIYRWIVKLGNGKYGIDVPNYSERIYIISK